MDADLEADIRAELLETFEFNRSERKFIKRKINTSLNKTLIMENNISKELELEEMFRKVSKETHDQILKNIETEHRMDHYLEFGFYLFNKIHTQIPSEYHADNQYSLELFDFLKQNGKVLYRKIQAHSSESDYSELNYYFLYKDMVICLTCGLTSKTEEEVTIKGLHIFHKIDFQLPLEDFEPFEKKTQANPKIGMIKQTKFGPQVTWRDFIPENKFHEDNYNDDFSEFYKNLTNKLETNKTGLYLFYGEAGTGKSSAIRHLITQVKRPFVFIPPQMINYLSNPEFTDLVTSSLKNSILIIEDAEKALMKRESEDGFFNSELVSSLLNLTDGLYADIASTSIIATYNCDRNMIDPALLRKGRMKAEYKFNKLNVKKSQNLINKIGYLDVTVDQPMTLADIYNYDKQYTNEERPNKKSRIVGFGG